MITEPHTFHMEQILTAPDTASIAECDPDGHRDGSTAASAISGLETPSDPTAIIAEATSLALSSDFLVQSSMFDVQCSMLSPVQDIASYLATRRPVPSHLDENPLFQTLTEDGREEVAAVAEAFDLVTSYINARLSVQKACQKTIAVYKHRWSLNTFRAKYDLWRKTQDWLVLVNRSKENAAWRDGNDGLPGAFIEKVCAAYFGRFKNEYGKRQAIFAIKKWWRNGRDLDGNARPMPGYESGWLKRNPEVYPLGWHYSNILRQIKARAAFTKIDQALLQEGVSAAKALLPQVHGTRGNSSSSSSSSSSSIPLRFLEKVTFDDVRTDWLVFDPETGQPCELWLLVARDEATAMILGFVMHLSREREDGSGGKTGSVSHLGLQEMKQLTAWILERYPLPPYVCTWKVERGTATLSEGSARALQEMLPNRIKVSFTSMIGGQSPVGYREKAKGNSRGKASHESHNRLFHTQGSYIPGQTGNRWDVRPADLLARCKESIQTWELRNLLPEHLRGQEKYTLLTPRQAREALVQICIDQNFRDDHALEGFEKILEWLDPATGKWMHQSQFPVQGSKFDVQGSKFKFRTRDERPVERALKLMAPYAGQWERVSPDIIIAFLSHTQRPVKIETSGKIKFRSEGRDFIFDPPHPTEFSSPVQGSRFNVQGSKLLGYLSPNDPAFLHVTTGKGEILGTWYRYGRIGHADHEALAKAIRYTATALKAAQEHAANIAAPERALLEAGRAHNAELAERGNTFNQVADAPTLDTGLRTQDSGLSSPIAAALASLPRTKKEIKAEAKQRAADLEDTRDLLRKSAGLF